MRTPKKPFSILRLHHHSDESWGVVDATGALVEMDGLSMKMTKEMARTYADQWNAEPDEAPKSVRPPIAG